MFLINCDNKGCGKNTAAVIDLQDGEAYCADCDRKITNITKIAKNQLKFFKQVRKSHETYTVKCAKCKAEARPKVGKGEVLVCPKCESPTTGITKPFESVIRQAIIDKEQEDKEDARD